jgi:tryptophan halogenase
MLGQGIIPSSYHPIVDLMSERDLQYFLTSIAADVDKNMAMLSTHQDFVSKYCGSI